jgi:hypothetical protein
MTITESFREATGSAVTYMTSAIGYACSQVADWNWMQIGAAVLLIARLMQDVPKAYVAIKRMLHKNEKRKSKR